MSLFGLHMNLFYISNKKKSEVRSCVTFVSHKTTCQRDLEIIVFSEIDCDSYGSKDDNDE